MTPGSFRFRDQFGGQVDLSDVTDRSAITKAEIYHVVEVDDGLQCQTCQSDGCPHTLQVKQRLAAAGLETGTSGIQKLPTLAQLTRRRVEGVLVAECWFDNGARIRCEETDDGTVRQSVFGPGQPREPTETTAKQDADSAAGCLVEALATYCEHHHDGDLDALRRNRPELARVIAGANG